MVGLVRDEKSIQGELGLTAGKATASQDQIQPGVLKGGWREVLYSNWDTSLEEGLEAKLVQSLVASRSFLPGWHRSSPSCRGS